MGKTKLTQDPLEEIAARNGSRNQRELERKNKAEEREKRIVHGISKGMAISAIPLFFWNWLIGPRIAEAYEERNHPLIAVIALDEREPVSIDSVILEQVKPNHNIEQKNVKVEEPKIGQKYQSVQPANPTTENRYEGIVAKWGPLVKNTHQRFPNVKESLIYGVIELESSWNPNAKGKHGEYGLGQLKASTAEALGVDRYNPAENLAGSVKYLNQLIEHYNGRVDLALANYNGGPKAVKNGKPKGYVSGYISTVRKKQRAFEKVLAR